MATENFLSVSSFKVTIDGTNWQTYETVTGLGVDFEDIAYQSDKNEMLNRPGRCNARNISLTRRFKNDKDLYSWVKEVKSGKINKKSGSVILLDDEEKEVVRFNFFDAWPVSWCGPTLSKDRSGNDILTEGVTLSVRDIELA